MSKKNEYQGHLIREVYPDSIAEAMEIEPGDVLLRINNQKIEDVFDYRYMIKDEYVEVLIRKPDGEEWLLEIEKEYDDDLGVEFENGLMSDYRSCSNKCIFCFIDQMPPGMRETLYFKDDDSRLSFLQGNYITLTNMKQKDVDRIIEMQLAPINISVQTTNPELRCKMLHNRFAGEKLKFLDDLYAGYENGNTPDGNVATYQIYSVGVVKDTSEGYTYQFADDAAFASFLEATKASSLYDTGVEVGNDSQIVTLSTCTREGNDDRTIVHGVRVNVQPAGE